MSLNDYVTMAELSSMLGVTVQRAHQLVDAYEIKFQKKGNLKLISSKDANKLAETERPTGVHVTKKS